MIAAVFHGPNKMIVQEVPFAGNNNSNSSSGINNNGNEEALALKVNACAVCGYDVRVYRNGHRKVSPPIILGHELCGEIQSDIKISSEQQQKLHHKNNTYKSTMTMKTGSRVAVCPIIPCLECAYCQIGEYNLCLNLKEIGSTMNGGFAQYVNIPNNTIKIGGLVLVHDSLSDEEAALLEPLACCLNSFLRLTPISRSSSVVIIGDGPMGLLHTQLFKRLAGARVAVVGKVPSRMKKAKATGADIVFTYNDLDIDATVRSVLDFAGAAGANVVVVATSSPKALEFALKVAGKNSKINIFAGMPSGQTFQIDPNWLHYNQVTITGTFSSSPAILQQAAELAAEKIVDLSEIITHQFTLEEIEKAMMTAEKYHGLRAVINAF